MGWFGRRSHSEVPSWASFFDDERFRAFLTVVEAELVSRGLTYELGDGVVALHGPGVKDGLTLGLQNLAQLCNHEPLAAWSDVVSGHFAGMLGRDAEEAELARRVHDFEAVRPSLRVRLYGEEVAGPERVTWPVADGLTAALVFDLPTAVRTVSAEDAGRWGRSREELYAIGLANALKEPVEVEEVQLEGGGVVQALMGPSFFTSARALSLDVPDDHPYGALVAVQRLLGDELRHVRLCAEVSGWLGGLDDLDVDLSDVGPPPGGEPPAARALLLVARELVVAEAESLAALRAFRDAATEPAVRAALQLLVADEALHVVVGRRLLPLLARTLPRSQTGPTLARLDDLMEADRRELRAAYLAAARGGPGRALGASLEPRDLRWSRPAPRPRVA